MFHDFVPQSRVRAYLGHNDITIITYWRNIMKIFNQAKATASAVYSKRNEYKQQAQPHINKGMDWLNQHAEKALLTSILISEIWQGESLDAIEDSSNLSAAVDYYDYTQR